MTKKLKSVAIALVLAGMLATPVLAYGSYRSGCRTVRYEVCPVQDCVLTGWHNHDGFFCNGHYVGDGHDYHGYCMVADCTITDYHQHNDVYCFGNPANVNQGAPSVGTGRCCR